MKVQELIAILQAMPADAQVVVFSPVVYFEELLPEAVVAMDVCELPERFVHRRPFEPRQNEKLRAYDHPENCEQNSPVIRAVLIGQ